jgi:UDP-GlcNAc:undecaprenyl-phosphate GlcNAc-1-phosphate transferase
MINVYVFGLALIIALLLTPLAKAIAQKYKIVDLPGERKIHANPISLTGGIAVYASFAVTLLLFLGFNHKSLAVLLVGLAFILFGFLDDMGIKMRARYKISAHLVFAFVFVWLSGFSFNFLHITLLNWLLTVGFITFMTNSINMLDGMDGLVSGIAFLAAGFFAILAFNSGQRDLLLISLVLMGALLGFLRYNFNPASIFLGETGSTFIGFMLAVMAIKIDIYGLWNVALSLGVERLQFISFIVPLIILGIPIFDTYFVFSNRFLHHLKFSQPGKDHSHHRIHLMGFSQKATVLTLYAIQCVLGAIALALVNADLMQFWALLTIVAIFFVSFTAFLLRVKVYS